jgi:hypothetical protein
VKVRKLVLDESGNGKAGEITVTMEPEGWIALLEWESCVTIEELRRQLRKLGVNV